MSQIEPIYEELIWKNGKSVLLKNKAQLEQLANDSNLTKMFNSAMKFYGASWPGNTPFTINLFPIPYIKDFKNSTTSSSMGPIEQHGILYGVPSDIKDDFGVIFHEICHSLYGAQSNQLIQDLETFFSQNHSPYRNQSYSYFNEALATAIGNGWAYEIVNQGKPDEGSWYNDKIIDGYARAILPLTKSYLQEDKQMDRDFVNQAIEIFGKTFPHSINSFADLMNRVVLLHEKSFLTSDDVRNLGNYFRISSYSTSSPINDQKSLTNASRDQYTLMIVLSHNEMPALRKISKKIPSIANNIDLIKKAPNKSIVALSDSSGRVYIIIKAQSEKEFSLALEKMTTQKTFNRKGEIIQF